MDIKEKYFDIRFITQYFKNKDHSNLNFDFKAWVMLDTKAYDLNKSEYSKLVLIFCEKAYEIEQIKLGNVTKEKEDNDFHGIVLKDILKKITNATDEEIEKLVPIFRWYDNGAVVKIIKRLKSIGIINILDFINSFEPLIKWRLPSYDLNEINNLTIFFLLKEKGVDLYEKLNNNTNKNKSRNYIVNHIQDLFVLLKKSELGFLIEGKWTIHKKLYNMALANKRIKKKPKKGIWI